MNNYDKFMSQDQKQLDEKLEIYIPNGPRLGTNVIESIGISKAYDDKLLYENLNFKLPQAGIVGIIGPNGAGKTTIFRMIMGEENPDNGSFKVGETAKIAYVDQSHSNIDPEKTIWENFADGVLTPSLWTGDKYLEGGLDPDRLFIVPNGYDPEIQIA